MSVAVAHNALPESRAAVLAAREWAIAHDLDLLVLHVEETGLMGTPGVSAGDGGVAAVKAAVQAIFAEFDEDEVPAWRVVATTSARDVAFALLHLVEQHDVELLVLGTRKRTEIGKYFMGRTVQRVLLDSPAPVLVVKNA